jgi:hypothetical protein
MTNDSEGMEVDFQIRFAQIALGSRIAVDTIDGITYSGGLHEVSDGGVVIYWFDVEWGIVGNKQSQMLVEKFVFVPYERIRTFNWTK